MDINEGNTILLKLIENADIKTDSTSMDYLPLDGSIYSEISVLDVDMNSNDSEMKDDSP